MIELAHHYIPAKYNRQFNCFVISFGSGLLASTAKNAPCISVASSKRCQTGGWWGVLRLKYRETGLLELPVMSCMTAAYALF